MLTSPILLDYQSSTPCLEEVVESMHPFWTKNFANPSSKSNLANINARAVLEVSRERIQTFLNLKKRKLIFTSGATESNNLALIGLARRFYQRTGNYGHIITLKTEHQAVLEPLRKLEKEGHTLTELEPEKDGLISKQKFLKALKPETFLVSIMLANNEIGVIQPLQWINSICSPKDIILHSDAAQCIGYTPTANLDSYANMITISSHKIYGPKGVGLLIIDEGIELDPLLVGGGQEFGLRSGTLPVPLIVGFTKAIELATKNFKKNVDKLSFLRDNLLEGLTENISQIEVNGSMRERLPHNLNITFSGVNGTLLHKRLKSKIICSSGSACSNGKPSHVLLALGKNIRQAEASLRLSIGLMTSSDDIEKTIFEISNLVQTLRK